MINELMPRKLYGQSDGHQSKSSNKRHREKKSVRAITRNMSARNADILRTEAGRQALQGHAWRIDQGARVLPRGLLTGGSEDSRFSPSYRV